IILYLKCIFTTHRYLIFSIPIIAVLLYGIGLYFFSHERLLALKQASAKLGDDQLIAISEIGFMRWTLGLLIVLPFLHLLFLPKVFYKIYDFTLPISAGNRLTSYILIALFITIYNSLLVLLMNFSIEAIFKARYMTDILEAYDHKGLL